LDGRKSTLATVYGQGVRASCVIFVDMRLHRVEAACAPNNERSRRCSKVGHREFRAYLLMMAPEAHLLFAILESDFLRESQHTTQ